MKRILGTMCGLVLLMCWIMLRALVAGLFIVATILFLQWVTGGNAFATFAFLSNLIPAGWRSYLGYAVFALFVIVVMAVLNKMAVRALMGNVPGRPWHFAALAVIDLLMFVVGVTLSFFGGYWIVFCVFSAFMLAKGLLCLDQAWRIWSEDRAGRPEG